LPTMNDLVRTYIQYGLGFVGVIGNVLVWLLLVSVLPSIENLRYWTITLSCNFQYRSCMGNWWGVHQRCLFCLWWSDWR
jgi:hypothetical protein